MVKLIYEKPSIEVIVFNEESILTSSSPVSDPKNYDPSGWTKIGNGDD